MQSKATETENSAHGAQVAPEKASAGKKAIPAKTKPTRAKKTAKKGKRAPKAKAPAKGVGDGSKTAKVLDLLKRPGGATLKEVMKATGWRAHSVRGFISGTLGKKLGLTVQSAKNDDSERTYRIVR